MPRQQTRPDRAGRKGVLTYVTPEVARRLKVLAMNRDVTIQEVLENAILEHLDRAVQVSYSDDGTLTTASGHIYTSNDLAKLRKNDLSRYMNLVLEHESILPSSIVSPVKTAVSMIQSDKIELDPPQATNSEKPAPPLESASAKSTIPGNNQWFVEVSQGSSFQKQQRKMQDAAHEVQNIVLARGKADQKQGRQK